MNNLDFQDEKSHSPKRTKFTRLLLNLMEEVLLAKNLDEGLEKIVVLTSTAIEAERGSVFLFDPKTNELFTKFAQGSPNREIRIASDSGIAGWVYTNNQGVVIQDVTKDKRFNDNVDRKNNFVTRNIICTPLKNLDGIVIGVTQVINKLGGEFTDKDFELLQLMTNQAAIALRKEFTIEAINKKRNEEIEILNIVTKVSSELQLGAILNLIVQAITKMLDAERTTLFINDEKTQELFTEVGEGLGKFNIRFKNDLGIAGTVFTTGETINIPHAYADLRFNPNFDRETGFFTRSILCMPVSSKDGKRIGVTQVLNKRGGFFSKEDEARLSAFTSQISMGIENATLFDEVKNIKNYNESILESMSNGVITFKDGKIASCNSATRRIFKIDRNDDIIGQTPEDFFKTRNQWIVDKLNSYAEANKNEELFDIEFYFGMTRISANVTIQNLKSIKNEQLGVMVMIEDISSEKRMKSTISRYMDSNLAAQLIENDSSVLGGKSSMGTILFSDIQSFTTVSEQIGAQETVALLNDYFTVMVDCIQNEGGMLDKFIGDAMMAIFGTPITHEDDADRGVRAAIAMIHALKLFNDKRKKIGKITIDHRVGLNTDIIVSGNIGSPKRMNYTAIGDGVNLASRLESACKQYGAKILMSEFTYKALKATYRTRIIDRVIVKGKTEAVSIYEILDYHDSESFPRMIDVLGVFNCGIEYYNKGEFKKAKKMFADVLKLHNYDKASELYAKRCEFLLNNPPNAAWKGIWVMTSK